MSDIITKPLNLPDNPPEAYGNGFVTFTAQEANSTIGLSRIGTKQTLEYSTDNINWNNFTVANTITLSNIDDVVYIRGILTGNNDVIDYTQFVMTGKIAASGNCNALWNYNNLNAPLKDFCGNRLFEQCTSLTTAPALPATVLASSCYQYMFNRCENLTTAPELPATTLAIYCYAYMFLDCTSLTTAPELPATTLTDSCYYGMFENCSNLNYIKCLATDISANSCTLDWVSGVSSTGTFIKHTDTSNWTTGISGIPTGWNVIENSEAQINNYITFTALENNVHISLNSISSKQRLLYSTDGGGTWNNFTTGITITLKNSGDVCYVAGILSGNNTSSYYTQFNLPNRVSVSGNINSLWNYTDLAQNLYQYCGYNLFNGCTGLIDVSGLSLGTSATTLANSCYADMFNGCTSLTTAPELTATILADGCYAGMFKGCTSLTTAPELPATTLSNYCYGTMFCDCTSLTTAPELPATILTDWCYDSMFQGCTSLITAPELPATILANQCYATMFQGCTSLNYIKCLATDISAYDCTLNWVSGVASTGTFVKNASMTSWTTGNSGIPRNWNVEDDSTHTLHPNEDYLNFSANLPNTKVRLVLYSDYNAEPSTPIDIDYSFDRINWTHYTVGNDITIPTDGKVYLRGNNDYFSVYDYDNNDDILYYHHFEFENVSQDTLYVEAHGNINSLLSKTNWNEITTLPECCYSYMFQGCTSLTTAPALPATRLANSCYWSMFYGCTSLTTAPELPATTLANGCYQNMFNGCTSLTTAPELPATTLATSCYSDMFSGCSSLTTAPELPATTLVDYCYNFMFYGCTSLTTAPALPATTLANECYSYMFYGCTSLNSIKCLATNISASNCTNGWVSGVASTGVFVKHPDISESTWGSGANGIPTGWTVIEDNKPVMPEDIANEIMQEVDIFAVPFNDLYETCLSVYLDMGYNVGDFDEVYAIIQSTPNLHDDVETFVISNDSNEKVITVDNNGDFYLKGVGGYDGKNTNTEDSNIKPLQDVINEKQEALVAGNNIQITDNTISATNTTYTASDFDIKDLADSTGLRSKWDNKQNALTAGNNIDITNNVITSKGYTYNNGTITTDGSVTVKGSETITGKITATAAKSHNLVFGGNELNLADVTDTTGKLYLNYRNSTNPINEYRFCKGVGNKNTYSDIRCGTLYQTSDITKKNVISDLDLDKAYDLIDKCQTIIYTLKDDERNKEQIGVIAQEIQEFFPEVVSADENGILAIDYSRLTVVIMKVLKDVIKRVQRLEEK